MFTIMLAVVLAQSPLLEDGRCGGDVVVEQFEGAALLGSCSTADGQRRLALTFVNSGAASAGTLNSIHLGFCRSSVARAFAPPGWVVTLDAEGRGVRFSRGGQAVNEPGIRKGRRVGGFVIELLPGWRYAREVSVFWENAGAATGTTHVC